MRGSITILAKFYQTTTRGMVKNMKNVFGFSAVSDLNTASQIEAQYLNAIKHAETKYRTNYNIPSSDEVNYSLLWSEIDYKRKIKTGKYSVKIIHDKQKVPITPAQKRRIHRKWTKNFRDEQEKEEKGYNISRKDIDNMYAKPPKRKRSVAKKISKKISKKRKAR